MNLGEIRKSSNGLFFRIEELSDNKCKILFIMTNYKIYMLADSDKIKANSKKVRKSSKHISQMK